ncbi:ROK family protein [Mucilaginibacter sp. JRF]|uniref:ROK family protein n=1 Tax=Mucilaginibacter sp. JRF TaxID=2780088 RepID=UPI00187F89F8|nr:ROK family protein [Mucilaginibacter sp. JRF]MBE9583212.1 ROK family protein [Mucilaginibacter sp. JRF]
MLLGFDIGGTKCAVLLGRQANDTIQIVHKEAMPTDLPVYEMIEKLFAVAEDILGKHAVSIDEVTGIGISCGGPLSSKRGLILSPPNLIGWDNVPIVKMAAERFNKPVLLQNDANACAVAEWKYGAGKGYDNLIFLTFGTGMGAGLILNGQLYSGISDLAGEVGHIRLADNGPVGFGKAGSFEGFCSGGGIAQIAQTVAREYIQVGKSVSFCNSLADLSSITAKAVAEAAYNGDEPAVQVYQITARQLGKALAIFIDMLNPEMIILGSIYGRTRELIEPLMMEVIKQEAYFESWQACKIVPAGLSENIGDMAALCLAVMSNKG